MGTKQKNKKIILYTVIYVVVLISFTVYVLLDTFVIERGYRLMDGDSNSFYAQLEQSSDSSGNSSDEAAAESSETTEHSESTENSADGEDAAQSSSAQSSTASSSTANNNISVTLKTYRESNTTIYVADIKITDIRYLKSAFAKSTYGRNVTQTTSAIAESCNAVLAINGDFYGAQNDGYVIRNGTLYRAVARSDEQEDLVIYRNGSCEIIREGDITAEKLLQKGALQVYSFGPALVNNKKVSVTEGQEVGKAMASNPRTAIGMIAPLHYVMVVADGRTTESTGLSLYQLAGFMQSLGVVTAYNLDGGGSSTMYYQGNVVNNPTTNGNRISERGVSDIVYIG